jgi:hypothetical protein
MDDKDKEKLLKENIVFEDDDFVEQIFEDFEKEKVNKILTGDCL